MRPCPECGREIKDMVDRCKYCLNPVPVAGDHNLPPSSAPIATGVRPCPFCAEDIQAAAIICRHCQRALTTGALRATGRGSVVSIRTWSPGAAAVLSFVIPGLGQLYKGRIGLGVVLFLVTALGYAAFILPGLALHLLVVYDAYNGRAKEDLAAARART